MTVSLIIDGVPVADYRTGEDLPADLAPRPRLHPVRTRSGLVLTAERPADHRHHLGVSLAVSDVNGGNYWGGRSFRRGQGSLPLDNHGRQLRRTVRTTETSIEERLDWQDRAGEVVITEHRMITARALDGESWALDWSSELRAERQLRIASSAVNGRPGAGYGGIFWRFPEAGRTEVTSPLGDGAEAIHERRATWIAVRHEGPDGRSGTVVLTEPGSRDPWFVRDSGYVGCGPAPASATAVELAAGEVLRCRLGAVVLDGWHTDPELLTGRLVRAGS